MIATMGASRGARTVLAWCLVAVACGPDLAEPLVCDGNGPMPLLVLDDDADEARVAFTVRDERGWLAVVGDRGVAIECGEVPREFVREITDRLDEVAGADARWLAYRPGPKRRRVVRASPSTRGGPATRSSCRAG
jgi:hypothetical protein